MRVTNRCLRCCTSTSTALCKAIGSSTGFGASRVFAAMQMQQQTHNYLRPFMLSQSEILAQSLPEQARYDAAQLINYLQRYGQTRSVPGKLSLRT